jgi:hypothetical protein
MAAPPSSRWRYHPARGFPLLTFVNESGEHAKQLAIVTPAVIGPQFFRDMAEVVNAGGPPDMAALAEVMRRHGLTPAAPSA